MSFRHWLSATAIVVVSLALSTPIAAAQGNGHGHDKHDRDNGDRGYNQDPEADNGHGKHGHSEGHGHGRGHYKDHDRDIHEWYRANYSSLPPGLAKRDRLPPGLERQLLVNGTLPPGLRKKMQPCPHELEVMLPPAPPNYTHVLVGGSLVLVNRVSFQIADVFHFDATF